jgi:cytochrome c oxidase subunit II
MQSMLSPHGPAASEIAELSWVLFAGGGAILVLVIAAIVYALGAGPQRRAWLARERFVIWAGVGFPVLTLSALLLYVYAVGERLHATPQAAVRIEVTAEQWWWRVRYLDAAGEPEFETANEIRVPAGEAVELTLRSADVIHSFWVPSLAGKIDMIPGRANRLVLSAAGAGTYRGQCAEFCGGPHALMALHVVAQRESEFQAWREQQRRPAASANALFTARCAACHAIRGSEAAGSRGPDLTHVASRLFIAAGTLPNTPANLSGWLADSQHVKPGSLMPSMRLAPAELQVLAAYLATLK